MFARNSLALRVSVLCASVVAFTVALMGAAILWLFTQSTERILDNHLLAYTDIIISQIKVKDNDVVLSREAARLLDELPRYWQISEAGQPLYKSSRLVHWLPMQQDDMMKPERIEWREEGKSITAIQTTFLFPQNRKITLISGMDIAVAEAYQRQEREELATPLYRVLLSAGLVLAVICAGLIHFALRRVRLVRASLQAIRAGEASRLEGDYPAEIKELTDEINNLLDYTAGSVTRYREFSSNLAHALKTPLTVMANETDIERMKAKLRVVMEIIERNLARSHVAGTSNILSAVVPVLSVLTDIGVSFGKVYSKCVEIDYPADINFKGDRADLYEVLGNVIENACKFSRSSISISEDNGAIVIEDDGAGIPEARRLHVLQRGVRLDENVSGTGIGLAVASDIVSLYHGDIRLDASASLGGLKVSILLPLVR